MPPNFLRRIDRPKAWKAATSSCHLYLLRQLTYSKCIWIELEFRMHSSYDSLGLRSNGDFFAVPFDS
jgi:hypothetical protein